MFNDIDTKYMKHALELAALGLGRTSPNPIVGCVIVRDDKVIGEGFHEMAGSPHAEVNAIAASDGNIEGATLYVSLEPCSYHGKTPPCSELIIKHKPDRVVVAMEDPNPQVSGRGIKQLKDAGIKVDTGLLHDEAQKLNEVFVKYITNGMPFVVAKCGMTLDGKIATHTGDSRWVTCEESRQMVHELRNQVDAILVGSRTVMMDDPSLTTRLEHNKTKDPIRVIVDADNYLDHTRQVFHSESNSPTWVAVPDASIFDGADDTLHIPSGDGGLDMKQLMQELAEREVSSVLIEGGGTTHASAFEAGIVDKVMFFIAPKIIGGHDAVSAVEGEGIALMKDALMLEEMKAQPVGQDILVEAYVKKS